MNRAREALEQGNTKFVARGENKKVFEEMKREFELAKNGEPESKKMKLTAPAAAPQEESDSSSDSSDSEQSSSHHEEEKSIEHVEDEAHFVTEPAEATQRVKQTDQYDHEAAMAWQAEMQRKEAAWRAHRKTPEANRIYCMADCEPTPVPSGHYKDPAFDAHLAHTCAEHDKTMKRYENEVQQHKDAEDTRCATFDIVLRLRQRAVTRA